MDSKKYLNWRELLYIAFQHKYFPMVVYIILWGLVHVTMQLDWGDDKVYSVVLEKQPFIDWVKNKYLTFNSRIITESILVIVLAIGDWLWRIIDISMIILLVYDVSEICFGSCATCRENWLVVCIIGMYPFIDMSTAGWASTSVNYTWPLALGLYALMNVKRVIDKHKISIKICICSILSTVIAGNVEQIVAILFAFIVIAIVYKKMKKERVPIFFVLELIVVLLDLMIIWFSPGRTARYIAEVTWSYPTYEMLSLVEKITIGITSTMAQFIARTNWIYLTFIIVVCYGINKKNKNGITIFTSYFPIGVYVILNIFPTIIQNISASLYTAFYYEAHAGMPDFAPIDVMNYTSLIAYLPLFVSLLVIGCIAINLYFFFSQKEKGILSVLIFLAGICTRFIMAFSPSIYESARRTYLCMYYAIIIVLCMVYKELQLTDNDLNGNMDKYIKFLSVLPILDALLMVLTAFK